MLYKANWLALIFVAGKEIQDENLSSLLNSYSFTILFILFHHVPSAFTSSTHLTGSAFLMFVMRSKPEEISQIHKRKGKKGRKEKEESLIQSTLILFWLKVPVNKARWIYFFHELWHATFQKTSLVYYIL